MSTWWYELKKAVQTRLTGDSTLVGLLANSSSIYQDMGKPEAASMYPYLFLSFAPGATPNDGFRLNMSEVRFDVQSRVGTKQKYQSGVNDPDVQSDLILARVLGDWDAQTVGTGPTYGLDRWSPGSLGSTGYTGTDCYRENGPIVVQDDNVLGLVVTFKVIVQKTGA